MARAEPRNPPGILLHTGQCRSAGRLRAGSRRTGELTTADNTNWTSRLTVIFNYRRPHGYTTASRSASGCECGPVLPVCQLRHSRTLTAPPT